MLSWQQNTHTQALSAWCFINRHQNDWPFHKGQRECEKSDTCIRIKGCLLKSAPPAVTTRTNSGLSLVFCTRAAASAKRPVVWAQWRRWAGAGGRRYCSPELHPCIILLFLFISSLIFPQWIFNLLLCAWGRRGRGSFGVLLNTTLLPDLNHHFYLYYP